MSFKFSHLPCAEKNSDIFPVDIVKKSCMYMHSELGPGHVEVQKVLKQVEVRYAIGV